MENYADYTKTEIVAITATYQAVHGERKYLTNILCDLAQDFNLTNEEKSAVAALVTSEITCIENWSNSKLLEYYEKTLNNLTYTEWKISDTKTLFLDSDVLYMVVHAEILRRMK